MSAAPRPTPRAPPGGPGSPFSAGCPILPAPRRASRSFVLAAARLRALHLDPLLDRRPHRHAARRTKNDQTNPLSPAPVFIERDERGSPTHPPRATRGSRVSLLGRLPHSAGASSRVQVVRPRRCAAAGAPPGPAPRPPAPQARRQKDEKRSDEPLSPAPVFIERLRLRLTKIVVVTTP